MQFLISASQQLIENSASRNPSIMNDKNNTNLKMRRFHCLPSETIKSLFLFNCVLNNHKALDHCIYSKYSRRLIIETRDIGVFPPL